MDVATRIDRKVTQSGEHRIWRGSHDDHGVGQIRIDGKLTTVRRVVWELANGPLPDGAS